MERHLRGRHLSVVKSCLPSSLKHLRATKTLKVTRKSWDSVVGGERGGGEPGICDGRMPLRTGQTNTVLPKRCDTPCLAQGRPKLRNICMTVRCRSPDGQRHRTVMQKALRNRSPPSASPPSKESRKRGYNYPKGPKIEKFQDRPPGLQFSIEIEFFKRATHQTPIFVGNSEGPGLKISSEIEIFNRD